MEDGRQIGLRPESRKRVQFLRRDEVVDGEVAVLATLDVPGERFLEEALRVIRTPERHRVEELRDLPVEVRLLAALWNAQPAVDLGEDARTVSRTLRPARPDERGGTAREE